MRFCIEYGTPSKPVYCEVSPCSYMYPAYGLQVQMSLVENACNAESVFVLNKAVRGIAHMPKTELLDRAMELCLDELAKLEVRQQLVDDPIAWAKAAAGFRKNRQIEDERRKAELARMKAKGYTHYFFGWVHPESGDDYPVRAFSIGEFTDREIAKLLKGSVVKTDYSVRAL